MNAAEPARVVSSDDLVDAPVVNAAGDELGRVAYVMLDVAEGRVAYAVLAHGDVLGVGEQLFAVPWQSLRLDPTHERFVLLPSEAPVDL
jgi:sporulation protein YlmC with PRC-barrel domain